jgi:hypothetical protein
MSGSQLSCVQALSSLQAMLVPVQVVSSQVSAVVQLLSSEQSTAVSGAICVQPRTMEQESTVHGLLSAQSNWLPVQTPPVQVSPVVQTSPSLQGKPVAPV